jgi:class 3 adenylate cyclase
VRDEDREAWHRYIASADKTWGSLAGAMRDTREVEPSRADDTAHVAMVAKLQRTALSPGAVGPLFETGLSLDVRDILSTVRVPTLVMHRERASAADLDLLASVATAIPGARYVVLPGEDHWVTAEPQEPMFDAISAFLAELGGHRATPSRKLATVLFTDIVSSTERSAELGDAEWKALLERHHTAVRARLARNGGREISTAGDGFFATFDGPAAAARCALDAVADVRGLGLHIRAGVHTGEVETIDGEIGGLGVTIGARVGALAGVDEVLASSTVRDLAAGSGLEFEDAGEHELKGVPDKWRLYRVAD